MIRIKMVRVRWQHFEVPVRDVFAVQVGWWCRDTDRRICCVGGRGVFVVGHGVALGGAIVGEAVLVASELVGGKAVAVRAAGVAVGVEGCCGAGLGCEPVVAVGSAVSVPAGLGNAVALDVAVAA